MRGSRSPRLWPRLCNPARFVCKGLPQRIEFVALRQSQLSSDLLQAMPMQPQLLTERPQRHVRRQANGVAGCQAIPLYQDVCLRCFIGRPGPGA
jgi:hypothetical protein